MRKKALIGSSIIALSCLGLYLKIKSNTDYETNPNISLEESVFSGSSLDSNQSQIVYEKLSTKDIFDPETGFKSSYSEFHIDRNKWNSLKSGLSKKELYHEVKNIPMKVISTMDLEFVAWGFHGDINDEDIIKRFMFSCDQFITNKNKNNFLDVDPEAYFTEQDKKIFDELLRRNIKSPIIKKERYMFPNKTEVGIERVNNNLAIEINVYNKPSFQRLPKITFSDEKEKDVINRYFLCSILSPDITTKNKAIPLDNLYRIYREGGK